MPFLSFAGRVPGVGWHVRFRMAGDAPYSSDSEMGSDEELYTIFIFFSLEFYNVFTDR